MASYISLPISCILLIIFTLLILISGTKSEKIKAGDPGVEFLRHLQGCHKGQTIKGVHRLKQYLSQFGYLNYQHTENHTQDEADLFDGHLEAAIKTYQLNYYLKSTGTLDAATVSRMIMPRCAFPDVVNGTMRGRHQHPPKSLHIVSHYSFFEGSPRWPVGKTHLTYAFLSGFPTEAVTPVARAFQTWASASRYFTFSRTQDLNDADIKIDFTSGPGGEHGDGYPFANVTLAHAFAPTDGRFHYNADFTWSVGPVPDKFDYETIALHEIGHLLGLHHSQVPDSIMYSSLSPGVTTKGLHGDDVQGIKALYNI